MLLDVVGCCWGLLDAVMLLDDVGRCGMPWDVGGSCWMLLDVA